MSLIVGKFNNYVEISRYSNLLYDGEIGDVSISSEFGDEFPRAAQIHIKLDSKQTGSMTLTGSTSEEIAFANVKHAKTNELFMSLTSVCISDELEGTMKIEALDEQGNKVQKLAYKDFCMGFYNPSPSSVVLSLYGIVSEGAGSLLVDKDVEVMPMDKITIDQIEKEFDIIKIAEHNDQYGLSDYKQIFLK